MAQSANTPDFQGVAKPSPRPPSTRHLRPAVARFAHPPTRLRARRGWRVSFVFLLSATNGAEQSSDSPYQPPGNVVPRAATEQFATGGRPSALLATRIRQQIRIRQQMFGRRGMQQTCTSKFHFLLPPLLLRTPHKRKRTKLDWRGVLLPPKGLAYSARFYPWVSAKGRE